MRRYKTSLRSQGSPRSGKYKHFNRDRLITRIQNSLNVFVTHAETCGGIFLVMRLSTILLFRGRRISVWNSIYLDEHGEEDLELKRGKALYLNQSRLEQLLKLFITQNMDHDTRILSKTQFLGISDA